MNATFAKTFCWGFFLMGLLLAAGALTESQAAESGDFKGTWVANGQYAFAILSESQRKRDAIAAALKRHRLTDQARFLVRGAPGPTTIGRSLHGIEP